MRAVVIWAVTLAGCFGPNVIAGAPCSVAGECPAEQTCVAQVCVASAAAAADDAANPPLDDASVPDDGEPAAGPFGAPALVRGVDTNARETDPSVSADRLRIVFMSERFGDPDLFEGRRASVADAFVATELQLNTFSDERSPELSGDALRLYFASARDGGDKLYVAARASVADAWGPPVLLASLSTGAEVAITVSADERTAVIERRIQGGGRALLLATRASRADDFGAPIALAGLGDARSPALAGNAAALYFHAGGSPDLFVARRAGAGFAEPTELAELSTGGIEAAPGISADERALVFERNGALFEATR